MGEFANGCRREVEELHRFFQDWFNGNLAQTDEMFGRFSAVLAEDFSIISPNGRLMERPALVDGVWQGWASRQQARIWVENVQFKAIAQDVGLVTYEEWQTSGDKKTVRLSSAIFGQKAETPNGVVWLHVHETWLDSVRHDTWLEEA